jgi:exodeoxyribonuclease VII large subunit
VQGNTAVAQVVRALRDLDALPEVDVIVIARGGGALEDLLPFNSEELIRAVAAAATPVVSAIGHEADRPLLDDVADLRASTPTDAAKRIVPEVSEELAGVRQARVQLRRCMERLVDRETDRLVSLHSRPVLAAPEGLVTIRSEEIERLLRRSSAAVSSSVVRAADQLGHLKAQVRALSPQKTLDRGYAVVELAGKLAEETGTAGHAVVRRPAEAPPGSPLSIRVAEGRFGATSTGTLEQPTTETGEVND